MLEALIFDFDGIIVDSEALHMVSFQQILKERYDIDLSREEYYQRYLAYNDVESFRLALTEGGRAVGEPLLAELSQAKTQLVHELFATELEPMPGALELIRAAREAGLGVGICSGAWRDEVEEGSRIAGVLELVQVIVSANDVPTSKPDPAGYRLARQRLCEALGHELPGEHCVAIEDAPAGVVAARAAGLHTLAVTTSTERIHLAHADRVVSSLEDVTLDDLRALTQKTT